MLTGSRKIANIIYLKKKVWKPNNFSYIIEIYRSILKKHTMYAADRFLWQAIFMHKNNGKEARL
ncbi:hypothetical protein BSR42_07635 [Megasphaera cerevisiae]|nr:hypothetical protein BSR42_07635 [Megasphaera cerevisiae]